MTRHARINVVHLSEPAAERIYREATAHLPLETGGLLVGYECDAVAVITDVIGAGPSGRHGPGFFLRDGTYSQTELERIYSDSGGRLNYWGEWHSHPRPFPLPSSVDWGSMKEISTSQAHGLATPLLIICERQRNRRWKLLAFQCYDDCLHPREVIVEGPKGESYTRKLDNHSILEGHVSHSQSPSTKEEIMALFYENLDERTRQFMLSEVERDLSTGTLYMSPRLNENGLLQYSSLLKNAIQGHNDEWLALELRQQNLIKTYESRRKPRGGFGTAEVPFNAPETLAEGEFNRFYMRGLCARAVEEGVAEVEIYRGKPVSQPRPESQAVIGKRISAKALLGDLRCSQGVEPALGLPPGPNSGLTIRYFHS